MKPLCTFFLFCNFCYASEVDFSRTMRTYLRCNFLKAQNDYSSKEFPKKIEVLTSINEIRSDKEHIQGMLMMTFASISRLTETSVLIDTSINRDLCEGWKTIRGTQEPVEIKLDMKKNESLLVYNYGSGIYTCNIESGEMPHRY